MRVDLHSLMRKLLLIAAACLFTAVFLLLAGRSYLAYRHSRFLDAVNLEAAVSLEPGNAEFYHLRGRFFFFALQEAAPAIEQYRKAISLNPYNAQFWLDLAAAQHFLGDPQEERKSLDRALAVDPRTPDVAWEAANFYLTQGDVTSALTRLKTVIENDQTLAPEAINLSWRATHNIDQILNHAIPATTDSHFGLLNLLIEQKQTAAAVKVWDHLISSRLSFPPRQAFPYIQFLLDQREAGAIKNAWMQLTDVQEMQPYKPTPANLIVNPGFEEDILNGGLDWRYVTVPAVMLNIDTSSFHDGQRSLQIHYSGTAGEAGLYQFIPVEPGKRYEFAGYIKTDDIISASGPRFSLVDVAENKRVYLSDEVFGSTVWRQLRGEFSTGPRTDILLLQVVREPITPVIKGQAWIDDLRLTPVNTDH